MDFLNRLFIAITTLHPTHPMVVHFPIALTGAAFLFILLAWWRKNACARTGCVRQHGACGNQHDRRRCHRLSG